MKEYASKIKKVNKQREAIIPKKQKKVEEKKLTQMQKAKEYAKHIPKPKQKMKPAVHRHPQPAQPETFGIEENIDEFVKPSPKKSQGADIEVLNQRHEDYLAEVNQIRNMFR